MSLTNSPEVFSMKIVLQVGSATIMASFYRGYDRVPAAVIVGTFVAMIAQLITVYHGLSWSIMVYHALSCYIMLYHALSCLIMVHHGSSCDFLFFEIVRICIYIYIIIQYYMYIHQGT